MLFSEVSRLVLILAVLPLAIADSCSGRCGQNLNTGYTCQCNTHCVTYGDCCDDYNALCLGETCQGRCDNSADMSKPCQCNTLCTTYGDCCPDYQTLCTGQSDSGSSSTTTCDLSCFAQAMWDVDNRVTIVPNYQGKTTTSGTSDAAPFKLFTSVDESLFQDPSSTYNMFIALLDNYNPTIGQTEDLTQAEWAEINTFLNAAIKTEVMSLAYNYLQTNGCYEQEYVDTDTSHFKVVRGSARQGDVTLEIGLTNDQSTFREQLLELWFNLYQRSSSGTIVDSSGFEHVLVGEIKSTVSGFHNWIQFYLEEKNNRIDYLGYVATQEPSIIAAKFEWNGRMKTKGSFFMGVSPEFDLAIYSICALTKPSSVCSFTMAGQSIRIQTWDVNHKAGSQIGSAYPIL